MSMARARTHLPPTAPSGRQPPLPTDPIWLSALLALGFLALCMVRLTIPSQPFFDEVHYLPPARAMLDLSHPLNQEHPPLGKEMIALGMAIFGDRPLGWRIMPALAGALALFAAMRALWFASLSRGAALGGGVLLATGFPLFVQSRIAMLDIFMAAFLLVALWLCAGSARLQGGGRWRLALAGVALGCAMASKWNAIPLAMLPGLAFLAIRIGAAGPRFLTTRRGPPVDSVSLAEAAVWLGLVPLAVYLACFWPFLLYRDGSVTLWGLFGLQGRMLDMQTQALAPHNYQSVWYHWLGNWRAIWYLYEEVDGAQRGVLLIGNPLTMLLGLPALLWCAWAGPFRRRWDALAVAVLFTASLGLWVVAAKNVQFYYHYFLPSCFLLAALALALDALWRRGWKAAVLACYAGATAMFVHFWPIMTAAQLEGSRAFERWMWLASWR